MARGKEGGRPKGGKKNRKWGGIRQKADRRKTERAASKRHLKNHPGDTQAWEAL